MWSACLSAEEKAITYEKNEAETTLMGKTCFMDNGSLELSNFLLTVKIQPIWM